MKNKDIYYMEIALNYAKKSEQLGEVPVGAVIVKDDNIISFGINLREKNKNSLAHAEIVAINSACESLGRWRLNDCTMYVTLEPCPMCAGAILNSRINRLVYGAADESMGAVGSVANIFAMPFNHRPKITTGVLKQECEDILTNFFKKIRQDES